MGIVLLWATWADSESAETFFHSLYDRFADVVRDLVYIWVVGVIINNWNILLVIQLE